ncbi:hypothetical protein ABFW14_27935, partial [Mycolicibacterium fortuitum]
MTTAIAAPRRTSARAASVSSAGASARPARSLTAASRYPQSRLLHIVAPSLKVPDAAAASVFSAVRSRGPVARDAIA